MAVTVVETVLFSVRAGELHFRVRTRRLPRGAHPDELARHLAGLTAAGLLHSTSWRFDAGAVVLTYAALPDPTPVGSTRLDVRAGRYATDPLAPSEVGLTAHDVAVHAGRHLAYLRRTDPMVATACEVAGADLWDAIGRCEPALAGALGGTTVLT